MRIVKAGLQDTIQDEGRCGLQRWGISVGGAFDKWSYRLGNMLLGNASNCASLEFVHYGPTIEFTQDQVITITGADMQATIADKTVPMWKKIKVTKGTIVKFNSAQRGMRTYLAVSGGILSVIILNSRSTFANNIGVQGITGRQLKAGDYLPVQVIKKHTGRIISIDKKYRILVNEAEVINLRVLALTTDTSLLEYLLFNQWQASIEMNRMGVKLACCNKALISKAEHTSQISAAVSKGTIQIPADGRPIILGADCQTIGGYPKPATVIAADLSIIAQLQPRQKIKFTLVTLAQAFIELEKQSQTLSIIKIASKLT